MHGCTRNTDIKRHIAGLLQLATSKPGGGATVGSGGVVGVGVGVGVGLRWCYHQNPPHYYDEVDEEAIASSPAHEDDDDDDDFTFSPASPPPLRQSTEAERTTTTTSPTTLYVFPMSTVVLKPDGGCERIADKHTITHPKPSTSTIEDDANVDEDPRKVCYLEMQNNIAGLIAEEWRASAPSTVEEVTVDVCRSLAFTILSAPYQEIIMKYVRCAIRRQP